MHSIAWDDLRYILAVAEQGSLAAAARALGVNHTTVLRRVNAFEAAQRVRLFDRLPSGYALTVGGEELLAAARRIGHEISDLQRRLAGRDLRLEGTVRATTTDTLMLTLLARILARFREAHPGIEVEVSVSNAIANLTRRDADVAIRPAKDPADTLVGRRVGSLAFAVYAAAGRVPAVGDLAAHPWVGPDDTLAASAVARWMRAELPSVRPALRADSLVAMREAAAAGLGMAPLPCYLGDTDARLARVLPDPLPGVDGELWVLTHADLRRTARVRAFVGLVGDALAAERDLLEGRRPQLSR